jgi:leucine dehydrogenase
MAELKIIGSDEIGGAGSFAAGGSAGKHFAYPAEETACADGIISRAEFDELKQTIERWEGLAVVAHYDRPTGAWVFIALHDATLGQAVGGCRMRTYPTPGDAARDAMRLAEAMTHKWAVIDSEFGGGKSVLAVPRSLEGAERAGLLERFGLLLEKLGGIYSTGGDLGTTPSDMAKLAEVTRYVHGFDRATGHLIDPGPYTALGVRAGIKVALAHVLGARSVAGRTVLIQGLGHVGAPLARMLHADGASLIISDMREERMLALAEELGCRSVSADAVSTTGCDVYAPCAMGGMLNRLSVSGLMCSIVAGAANNQLESAEVADQLHARAILYAPDYVINAGGAIALPLLHRGASEEVARARVEGIAATLGQIFDEAARLRESPLHAAERKVERVLAAARAKVRTQGEMQGEFSEPQHSIVN